MAAESVPRYAALLPDCEVDGGRRAVDLNGGGEGASAGRRLPGSARSTPTQSTALASGEPGCGGSVAPAAADAVLLGGLQHHHLAHELGDTP